MKLELSKKSGNFELIIWTVYYLLMFTIGRYENFQQIIVWGGAIMTFGLSFPFLFHNFKKIPKESLYFIALWFWSLTGGLVAINMDGYLHYLRMIAQMAMVIIFFGTICRKTVYTDIFVGSLIIPPLFIMGDMLFNKQTSSIVTDLAMQTTADRAFGLANDPNAFGVMCCVGIWAALMIIGKYSSKILRMVLISVIIFLIYSIILSASRSAFIICTFEIVGWMIFCIPEKINIKGFRFIIICLLFIVLMFSVQWVIDNTVLGVRSTRAIENFEDESRVKLIVFGLELFLQSPFIGHGLAQFVELSETRHYAHNDLIELLATTGFPGAILYYLPFVIIIYNLFIKLRQYKNTRSDFRIVMNIILLLIFFISGMFNANFASMEWAFLNAMLFGGSNALLHDMPRGNE